MLAYLKQIIEISTLNNQAMHCVWKLLYIHGLPSQHVYILLLCLWLEHQGLSCTAVGYMLDSALMEHTQKPFALFSYR